MRRRDVPFIHPCVGPEVRRALTAFYEGHLSAGQLTAVINTASAVHGASGESRCSAA
jgi:hypothetical protein